MQNLQANRANNALMLQRLERLAQKKELKDVWPEGHLVGGDGFPAEFHIAQKLTHETKRRIIGLIGGSQLGKTGYAPWWLKREIDLRGKGDYLAVTSSYDLFRLKLLPSLLQVFEEILKLGRFWTGDKVFELKDPATGEYWARKATDPMWGRVILRSAQSLSGLESATAKAAILDEAGQDDFTVEAWRAIKRRLTLNRGRILLTTTLYNLGWLNSEIIIPAIDGGTVKVFEMAHGAAVEYTDNEKKDTALIQADSIVNPAFPLSEYEDAKEKLPPDVFAMFFRGRTARPRFMIYDCFDESPEGNLIPRFAIPPEWDRYIGLDFGGVNTVALFAAEDPGNKNLFIYRAYKGGNKSAKEHTANILYDEPGRAICYGGAKAEGQWRREFREAGLPIRDPKISDVWLGINKTYACIKQRELFFFDDLDEVRDEILNYRRKTDENGEPTDEIFNKNDFHFLDALRYVVPSVKRDRKVAIGFA